MAVYNLSMHRLALFLLLLLSPLVTSAQEFNAGIVQGLWYSSDTILAGKPVRIYVAIRNNTGADLTGRVEFFADDKLIERNTVSALDGRIIESWADWTPTKGEHTITASFSRIELSTVGSSTQAIEVTSALAEDTVIVDIDTDGDGVGNTIDTDDDGDGQSDEEEKENGTDPLVYDEPQEEEIVTEEEDTKEDGNDQKTETSERAAPTSSNGSAGLERFLTPSPARTALTSVTDTVLETKRNLDAYRTERDKKIEAKNNPLAIEVNDGGFGEVTRTKANEREIRKPEFKEGSFISSAMQAIGNIVRFCYGGILAGISFFLGHPILVQLVLLFGILFGIYKLAKKYGARKSK